MDTIKSNIIENIGFLHDYTPYLKILFVTESKNCANAEEFLKNYLVVSRANDQEVSKQTYTLGISVDHQELVKFIYKNEYNLIAISTQKGSEHTQKVLEEIDVELTSLLKNTIYLAPIMDSERTIVLTNLDELKKRSSLA